MKIFVAGGSGFIGSHVSEELANAGHLVRRGFFETEADPFVRDPKFDYYWGDLTDWLNCKAACEGMDAVVMCAAESSGAETIVNNPMSHAVGNTVMNTYMMNAAWKSGIKKFVFISSSTVYPPLEIPARECWGGDSEPEKCYLWVGHMKRYAEYQGWLYATNATPKMPFVAIRPGNVYGPGDKFGENGHMVAAMIRKMCAYEDPLKVWGTGEDVRDHVYVKDVARAVRLALEAPILYAAYNVGVGKGHNVNQVIDELENILQFKPDRIYQKEKPQTAKFRVLNVAMAEDELGFKAKYSLADGLKETVEWYKEMEA